jgi:tetratricopeptide (TPR) repeat protein
MGRLEEAKEQYKLALKTNPNDADIHSNYGLLLSEMGKPEKAEKQYKLALEADPKHVATHHSYGLFLKQMGRPEEAEEHYKLALRIDPKNVRAHSNYGNLLIEAGRLEEAEKQFKVAIGLDPKKPDIHGAYSILLFSRSLEIESIEEMKLASRLFKENGDIIREHLVLAWLYEEFANKYSNLKNYNKSGEYAELSGNEYIEAANQAGEKFKVTSFTRGYTLKGRANIQKLDFQPPYNVEMFKKIINGINDASKCYKNAAEAYPKDNRIYNACSVSMSCLSEILDYLLAIITQENVPKPEGEIVRWKEDLANCEKICKVDVKGETFIQSLYKLIARIENLNENTKSVMWKEEKTFNEYVEELSEVARNIEGPLQKIIGDSAKQMDNCRLKIIPHAGIKANYSTDSTDINKELELNPPIEPIDDNENTPESKKHSMMLKWIHNPQAKSSVKSAGNIIVLLVLAIILTGVMLKKFSP